MRKRFLAFTKRKKSRQRGSKHRFCAPIRSTNRLGGELPTPHPQLLPIIKIEQKLKIASLTAQEEKAPSQSDDTLVGYALCQIFSDQRLYCFRYAFPLLLCGFFYNFDRTYGD